MPVRTRRRLPLTTSFVPPEDTHTVVVLTDHYWGKGTTKDEAMAECKRQGGQPSRTGYIAYYFGEGLLFSGVNDLGHIFWTYTVSKEVFDQEHGLRSVPVKEEVLHPQE